MDVYFRTEDVINYVDMKQHERAEQRIEREIKQLIQRPDIALRVPMTDDNWRDFLYRGDSALAQKAKAAYELSLIHI